jgi:hypothetical protein
VKDPGATNCPQWADQISSLDRQHVARFLESWGHSGPEINSLIETLLVETRTFEDVVLDHKLHRLDLLFLDTEGLDFRLLKHFPFDRLRPELIVLELSHLTGDELAEIPGFFTHWGYTYYVVGEDLVARQWHPA